MAAGAVYHRVLTMGRAVDDAWIGRVTSRVTPIAAATGHDLPQAGGRPGSEETS